uniref:Uncharacterized protein n=1 Tax=Romanomermis culicivorax TaxID=13658 RepID=A0A915KNT5_ROMCU
MGTKSREPNGVKRVTLERNQEKMWRCLQFKKGKHALKKWWLGPRCHFDGRILATGSGYNSEMMRVVVCRGQSSSGLWWSNCHNFDDDGIPAADHGFWRRATEWG